MEHYFFIESFCGTPIQVSRTVFLQNLCFLRNSHGFVKYDLDVYPIPEFNSVNHSLHTVSFPTVL